MSTIYCRTPVRAGTILEGVNVLVAGDESFKVCNTSLLISFGGGVRGGAPWFNAVMLCLHRPRGLRLGLASLAVWLCC